MSDCLAYPEWECFPMEGAKHGHMEDADEGESLAPCDGGGNPFDMEVVERSSGFWIVNLGLVVGPFDTADEPKAIVAKARGEA